MGGLTCGITNGSISGVMDSVDDVIAWLERSPSNIKFNDLCKVCDQYFGEARQKGTSHRVYKTPWLGDPRVNVQEKNGKAKGYQVRQVIKAIKRLGGQSGSEAGREE